jgi:hypothetical protein
VVKIGPPIANVPLLDFSHTAELIEAGYVHALAGLKEARARETSWTSQRDLVWGGRPSSTTPATLAVAS